MKNKHTLEELKILWESLGDISVDENEEIEQPFLDFEIGTNKYYIWKWFDEQYPLKNFLL